jgi:non-specific serine/threonine protein kinase/serine/threonine-protein kinase
MTFAIAMTIQAQRIGQERDQANREREEAQLVSNVAMNVFAIADPYQNFANGISGTVLLDQAAKSIERELRDRPAPRARLLRSLGRAYARRDQFKSAIACLTEAVNVLRSMPGEESEALEAMSDLSMALRNNGDFRGARAILVSAEDIARDHGLYHSTGYARLILNRARIGLYEGRMPAAIADFERSLQLYKTIVGPRRIEIAEVMGDLSTALLWIDDVTQAEKVAREAIEIFDVTAPPLYPDRIASEATLAEALYMQNRLDESAVLLEGALRKSTEVFGPNSVAVMNNLDRLALVAYGRGDLREAESYSRDAIAKSRITFGEKHYATALWSTALGRTLAERGKYQEAERVLRQALETFTVTVNPDHQYIASTEYLLGELLLATNRLPEAETILAASMNRWKRGDAPPWRAMRSANALGEALYRQGRTADGQKLLSESLRELSTDPKADRDAKDKARARAKRYLRTTLAST